eukprot:m.480945 g.480945  ORF g.480945 m.480945 type:complete len:468 (+) comp21712_c0_seq7:136-1539(+)
MASMQKVKAFFLHPVTRRVIRVARVGALSFGLVTSGYMLGSVTVIKDPKKYELEYMQQALSEHRKKYNSSHFHVIRAGNRPEKDPILIPIQPWVEAPGVVEDAVIVGGDRASTVLSAMVSQDNVTRQPHAGAPSEDLAAEGISVAAPQAAPVLMQSIPTGNAIADNIKQVQRVGHRVVCAAESMIREQIEILQAAVEDEQGASTVTIGGQSMTLERLEEAYRMLTMEEWKFVYIESDDRNAFVNSCVPRRVFVPAGLVRLCSEANLDGALALALSHEVSHVVLNHTEGGEWFRSGLRMAQLVILAVVDPSGIASLGLEALMAMGSPLTSLSYSREQEAAADVLGLHMTARACYRPADALALFRLQGGPMTSASSDDIMMASVGGQSTSPSPDGVTGEQQERTTSTTGSAVDAIFSDRQSDAARMNRLTSQIPLAWEIYSRTHCNSWRQYFTDWWERSSVAEHLHLHW